MKLENFEFSFCGKKITLETGEIASQADASMFVKCGDNRILVTVISDTKESQSDFFPLTVEYTEKFFSTGRIPGGYFKREGRPANESILVCRLIDRPMRPCFPEGYRQETQIVATVLSSDSQFPLPILATLGASAACHISNIPFDGPIASVQVAEIDGQLVGNPSLESLEKSTLNMIVSGTSEGLLMVEAGAQFIEEKRVMEALKFAHKSLTTALDVQNEMRKKLGEKKREFLPPRIDEKFITDVKNFATPLLSQALKTPEKKKRYEQIKEALSKTFEEFTETSENSESELKEHENQVTQAFNDLKYKLARDMILKEKTRIDGRNFTSVRNINCRVGLLPRVHGSSLFTRGETQVMGSVTLGTSLDEQMIDSLHGLVKKQFMLHYNFPPYSVGEVGRMGGQSRREIGHGFLAEKALSAVLPEHKDFPYTVRLVGDVMSSNGSSSMGTVCAGLLAFLDAGIPIKENVAGIAMGLVKEDDNLAILSDILGDEDHLGDMDFKVAGGFSGITALQMDIKVKSLSFEIIEKALFQALEGRCYILKEMEKVIQEPRKDISQYAPRITTIQINPEKVREVIGVGGKVIRQITEESGARITIEDDGRIHVASSDPKSSQVAIDKIQAICAEAEVGKTYKGRITKITEFGAFVEILPNTSGLLHISEIAHKRIRKVSDVLKEGEEVEVKVLDVDRSGRIRLSRKALIKTH